MALSTYYINCTTVDFLFCIAGRLELIKKIVTDHNLGIMAITPVLIVSFLLLSVDASGQAIQTGVITGKITDSDGEPMPNVKVTLLSDALSRNSVSTITDSEGSFRIPGLSPGVYKVVATIEGYYQPVSNFVNLRVATINELTITLAAGEAPGDAVDQAGGPMLTLISPEKGYLIPGSLVQKIPVYNDLEKAFTQLPGTNTVDNGVSVNGSSPRSNIFYYQGMNITDPYEGGNIINLKFPHIQTIYASGPGKSVQNHGTGVSIGIISASETDEISLDTSFFYATDFMKGEYEGAETSLMSDLKDFSIQVGGPVGDERFWVQGSYMRSYHDHSEMINAFETTDDSEYTLTARGSFFSSNNNQISGLYLGNGFFSQAHFSPDLTSWTILEEDREAVTSDLDANADFLSIRDELHLSDNMRLDVSYTWMSYNKKIIPTSGLNTLPSIVDPKTKTLLQGSYLGEWQKARGERLLFSGNLDFYLDEMAGTHEILLGLEVERDELSVDRGFDGSYKEYHYMGAPLYRKFYSRPNSPPSDVKSELTLTRFSIYGQDSWFPRPNISVNFGVVYNGPQVENRYSRVIDWDDISPRLAASWDVFSDGKTILRAGVARFHESSLGITAPQDLYGLSTVFWHESLVDLGFLTGVKGRKRWRSERDTHTFFGSGDIANRADLETESPYTDEFFVTLEHEPMQDVSVGASFIYRRSRNILEDYEVLRDGDSITENPGSLYNLIQVKDSNGDSYYYYQRQPGTDDRYDPEYYWSNDSRLFRNYYAVQIFGRTRPIAGLQLLGNYTLSSSRGNIDVTMEETSTYSWSQNNPSRFINAEGYLSNDCRHKVNLAAVYYAPYQVTVGIKASFYTGKPFNRYLSNFDLYDLNYSIRANPRGEEYRYDSTFLADLRLEKEVTLARNSFLVTLDVFNLLGSQAATRKDERDGEFFSNDISLVNPRTIQLGISYRF